jgi:hypothetical protein
VLFQQGALFSRRAQNIIAAAARTRLPPEEQERLAG